ncbi:hypothetical protein D7B24_004224 [Verticillium nonalfalfae]|uniref:AAA+ ATPase domain-containing protein n=1 Tax=Verticillium nonalfalfae TaxID=1051616 RepID=A0A3M9XX18_9PEZI|nr:uncharacterized protein D7B24_004224 [Verticillium nonalfalfae]RNJ52176.1 hypothetical protein D7B24_004224 [Verticillium nonalfalfae]
MDSQKDNSKDEASASAHADKSTVDIAEDSDSGDSRSIISNRSSDSGGQSTLFISSTISRDDTLSKSSKKRDLLSKIGSRFEKEGVLQRLNKSDENQWSLPPPPKLLGPEQAMRSHPDQGPHSRPPPFPRQPAQPNRRSPAARPKALNDAKWRQSLMKKRGPLPGVNTASQSPERSQRKSGDGGGAKSVSTASKAPDGSTSKGAASHTLGLAESLTEVMEKHLDLDVMDQSQETSQFIAYLLDTIELLHNQLNYARAPESDPTPASRGSHGNSDSQREPPPRVHILHQIHCPHMLHPHDTFTYEDEPKTMTDANTGFTMLAGKVKVSNLEAFLSKHPEICFVVFKEHDCAPFQSASSAQAPRRHKALKQVAEFPSGPGNSSDSESDYQRMEAPYLFLFHHRQKLESLAESNPTYGSVLMPLLNFIKDNYGQEYKEADELLKDGCITAKYITKLFKPNHVVLSRRAGGTLEAFVLESYAEVEKDRVDFVGWSWQYDGSELFRKFWSGKMNRVAEGRTPIADLSIHPIKFARVADIEALETRGRQFWDMRDQVYKCYTGWDKSRSYYYVDARFMVDVSSYQLMHRAGTSHPRSDWTLSPFDKWPTRIDRSEENLPPDTIMLLPATIYGFSFQEKKWVNLNVENFFPVNWNKKAFERLVLDPKTKEMIYALVDVQSSAEKMDDIIKGKGNGLIVLLHGSPGTGKTLTAESVAEIAEKPLYRVTCGDIGTDAKEVEDYLQTVLHLGKIWDCDPVLLLDEADVFLEERTMADLQRNSLVTVFLRVLEYYEGILMLTSNRVGTFDEAFKSRIQVAIHYDNLSKKARKAIWRNFFDMIEDSPHEDVNMPELERRLDELSAEEMNGRQIRNALRTARQLAKHRNERLDWPHLSQVIKTSGAFNKYLKAVRGHSDDQWAREEMIR